MTFFISVLIISLILPIILNALSGKTDTDSIYNFKMRMNNGIGGIGIIGGLFFGFCLYGSTIAGQTGFITTGVFGFLFFLSVLLLFLPTPGFWENEVKDTVLISKRLYFIRKHININEIQRCVVKANQYGGSIGVYRRNRLVCVIDLYQDNCDNFLQRMEKEGIPVEEKISGRK